MKDGIKLLVTTVLITLTLVGIAYYEKAQEKVYSTYTPSHVECTDNIPDTDVLSEYFSEGR